MKDEEVARHWDDIAESWEQHSRKGKAPIRDEFSTPAFLDFIGDVTDKRILELGCAQGRSTRLLAERGAHVTGADIAEKMLALARRHEEQEPLGIEYVRASLSDLSVFADDRFDMVVSNTLMDMGGLDIGSREIYRVLKSGGMYAFSVRHPCFVTADFRIVRIQSGDARLVVGRYFAGKPRIERISSAEEKPMKVPRFPHTLADYINHTAEAGFRIEQILEPRPSKEACQNYPSMRFWRRHAALFMFLKAIKP